MAWLRGLLRSFAAGGGAVLVSSHLLAEMQLLADRVVVIGRGRLRTARERVLVRSPDAGRLAELLGASGAVVERTGNGELTISGVAAQVVGDLGDQHRLRLHELATQAPSLEAAFIELTGGEVEYATGGGQ